GCNHLCQAVVPPVPGDSTASTLTHAKVCQAIVPPVPSGSTVYSPKFRMRP
ncbi:unnamed protein product, partial [Musa textilis]